MKLMPPVNVTLFWVSVMGVCLWFENPIACLFEQVVMPEHFIISGETITQPNKDECLQLCWGCLLCVWLFFLVGMGHPRDLC
jgi:hypothetical protein